MTRSRTCSGRGRSRRHCCGESRKTTRCGGDVTRQRACASNDIRPPWPPAHRDSPRDITGANIRMIAKARSSSGSGGSGRGPPAVAASTLSSQARSPEQRAHSVRWGERGTGWPSPGADRRTSRISPTEGHRIRASRAGEGFDVHVSAHRESAGPRGNTCRPSFLSEPELPQARAELLQAPGAGGPDAAQGHAQRPGRILVAQGRLLEEEQAQQALAALVEGVQAAVHQPAPGPARAPRPPAAPGRSPPGWPLVRRSRRPAPCAASSGSLARPPAGRSWRARTAGSPAGRAGAGSGMPSRTRSGRRRRRRRMRARRAAPARKRASRSASREPPRPGGRPPGTG